MKRILLISRCPPYPLHLGDRLIIGNLVRQFAQRGYVVDLLAYAQQPSDYDEIEHYRADFRHITLIDEPRRTPLMYAKRLFFPARRFPQSAQAAWSGALWQAIAAHLAQHEYDVVHLFGGVHVYEFAHLLTGFRTVITPYESYSLYLKRRIQQVGGLMNSINHRIAQRYESWMFTPYGATVVLTEQDKTELLSLNPRLSVEVIPNGIDLDYFVQRDVERHPATLLFVGNYEYEPNRDAALVLAREIFPRVQKAMPEARLQLVGHAPPAEIRDLASDSIEVTGRVPDVRDYLATATVFACPLRIGAGIKNKVLEALAMGLPVVATPLSLDGIHAGDDEAAIRASLEDFPQQVIRLLQDTQLQQQLSQQGRHVIESAYSWSQVADRYLALYDAD